MDDIPRHIQGMLYERMFGEHKQTELRRLGAHLGQRRQYIYGKDLNVSHVTWLLEKDVTEDRIRHWSLHVLENWTNGSQSISSIMGMDGLVVSIEETTNVMRPEIIVECKITGAARAIHGTFRLSARLHYHNVQKEIHFITPSTVKISKTEMREMAEMHKHIIKNEHFDYSEADMIAAYNRSEYARRTETVPEAVLRLWQIDQHEKFKTACLDAQRLRLDVTMGAGKTVAIAQNAYRAPRQFGFRVICSNSVAGTGQQKNAFLRIHAGEDHYYECTYKTSCKRGRDSMLANDAVLTTSSKKRIRKMVADFVERGRVDVNSRPPSCSVSQRVLM